MKNLLKMSVDKLIKFILVVSFICGSGFSYAAPKEENLEDLTFKEMINSVDLGDMSNFIQQFQYKEANKNLFGKYNKKNNCRVDTYRNNEILVITIPTKHLFAPNETLLNESAGDYLAPLKRYLKEPDTYRVLLVVHTDNTGSEAYRDVITEERADSIFEWFEEQGCDTTYLFPYAMGDDIPYVDENGNVYENDSQANRDKNRRLEVYLMPGTKMLSQAKKGKIEF